MTLFKLQHNFKGLHSTVTLSWGDGWDFNIYTEVDMTWPLIVGQTEKRGECGKFSLEP